MVSVIIPTYNRETLIERSVRSVLEQTYTDLEVIVVDDCSTDNTRQRLEAIQDTRLRYTCLERNSGACVARNSGIDLAQGEYIAFQDSDDQWEPQKLEKQMHVLARTDADIVFCKLKYHKSNGVQLIPRGMKEGFVEADASLFGIGTQAIVAKRKVFDNLRFDTAFPRYQDLELMYRAGKEYSLYCLAEGLVDYAVGTDSISSNPEKLYQACLLILEKHPEIKESRPVMMKQMAYTLLRAALDISQSGAGDPQKYIALSRQCKPGTSRISFKECLLYLKLWRSKKNR